MKGIKKRFLVLAAVLAAFYLFFRANYEVPILMYHQVSDAPLVSSLNVRPENFRRQMEFLKTHGYRVTRVENIVERLRSGKRIDPKTVAITFDDGNLDNFTNAFPVLKKMGFPAAFFMITENINKDQWLSEEDLKILDDSGMEVGSHTVTHAFLPKVSEAQAAVEMMDSKKRLEDVLGHPITLLSYPAGGVTQKAMEVAQKAGYAGAVTTNHGKTRHHLYALHRIKVSDRDGNLFRFWAKTTGLYHLGKKRHPISTA
ncbi:MAG: polysaccharide deacetylase family protein [Candidatus Omnitrophica bacterium]|nr:polysaccharide deacetylase family protein [Candidatus Omnitrophota bacterium]